MRAGLLVRLPGSACLRCCSASIESGSTCAIATRNLLENPATTLLAANKNTVTLTATNTVTGATASLPYNSTLVPAILSPNRWTSYAGYNMPAFAGGIPFPFPGNILQAAIRALC